MSDIMRPMPFGSLMTWALEESRKSGSLFGVAGPVKNTAGSALPIFGEKIEAPFGPAAGPNTQLAQNIVAAYAAGARFFELKTVQTRDGPELARCISKPCIAAPASASDAPTSATHSTRGKRTGMMTDRASCSAPSDGTPFTASAMTRAVSRSGMPTLPRQTHAKNTHSVSSAKNA